MIDIIELEGKQDNLCRKFNKDKGKHNTFNITCSARPETCA